jgi:hypothetical protein
VDGWTLSGWGTKATASWSDKEGVGGGRTVFLKSDDEKSRASAAQFVTVLPGRSYRIAGKVRGEGVDADKAVVRLTFLQAASDPSGPNYLKVLKPTPEWSAFADYFTMPRDKSVIRIDLFLLYGKGRLWYDDLALEEADAAMVPKGSAPAGKGPSATSNQMDAALAASLKSAASMRQNTLAVFEASRKGASEPFRLVFESVAARAKAFFEAPLRPVDMATVVGRPYGSYNMDVWRLRTVSEELQTLALCLSIPGNAFYGKPEALAKADAGFQFLAEHFGPEGSTRAPDGNIDRFIFGPLYESFVLLEDRLRPETRRRIAEVMVSGAYFQMQGFGRRPDKGTYPNMDAAYLFIMQAAGMLFGEKDFIAEADATLGYLGNCMKGGTYEYIQKWNPDPRYTKVVLEFVGRYWQLSGSAEAKRQIAVHRDYLVHYMEPGGTMDYGMSPFIKHDWTLSPYGAIGHALELVHRVAPDPVLQTQVNRMRALGMAKPAMLSSPYLLYWLSADLGKAAPAPASFLRESAEIEGMQLRTSGPLGTLTCYLTGKAISVDTRVSAIFTPQANLDKATALAGIYLELMKDLANYHLGDMEPVLSRRVEKDRLSLTVTQRRHTLGPKVEPLPYGGHMNTIKDWKYSCWKGGSPDSPPILTTEAWALDRKTGFMTGEITVTAESSTTMDEVRLRSFLLPKDLSESKLDARSIRLRADGLCLEIAALEGAWSPRVDKTPYHFRIDVPDGAYTVSLTAGDGHFPTEPFGVVINDREQAETVRAEKGAFCVKSFPVEVKEGAIRLAFMPQGGDHWKVSALVFEAKNGKFRRAFDVGSSFSAVASGYEKLSGEAVYGPKTGYGWFRDLKAQERDRGLSDALTTDPITCPDGLETRVSFTDGGARAWKKGDKYRARVTVGMAGSLEDFSRRLP